MAKPHWLEVATRKPAVVPAVREPRARYGGSATPTLPKRTAPPADRLALFDVNVLIALLDADHIHHARASAWLAQNIAAGWASCAITQNGCVRIMSQPGYPNALPTARVAERLREAVEAPHHLFVSDDASLLDPGRFDTEQLLGHRQVTDAYLCGLAVAHGLRLVTFDANVAMRVVRGADAGSVLQL